MAINDDRVSEDTDILTAVDEEFECLHDESHVLVNLVNGKCQAEVIMSGVEEVDQFRIQTALDIGASRGQHSYARVHGVYGNILIYFCPDRPEVAGNGGNN